jgi:homoserine acetyltransferase
MPVVCDFQWVNGVGTGIHIGDGGHKPVWEANFHTGGRHKNGHAVLVFMVRGLTGEHSATVKVNNQFAGRIEPYTGADPAHWFVQMINISGGPLISGVNELQIDGAPPTNPAPGNQFDDFQVKNVLCFFQQEA